MEVALLAAQEERAHAEAALESAQGEARQALATLHMLEEKVGRADDDFGDFGSHSETPAATASDASAAHDAAAAPVVE